MTRAPAVPGRSLGLGEPVWTPAEGPGQALSVQLRLQGPPRMTTGDACDGPAPPLDLGLSKRDPSFLLPLCITVWPTPHPPQNSKSNIRSAALATTANPPETLLLPKQPRLGPQELLPDSPATSPLLSGLCLMLEKASPSPVPNHWLHLGPPLPSPSKPTTLLCLPPSPSPLAQWGKI